MLENGDKREEVNVTSRVSLIRFQLDAPLKYAYPAGPVPRILKSQQWGIVAIGPESKNNVIMGNQCSENMIGGLLYHNPGGSALGNVGDVVAVDTNLTFMRNVHPAVAKVELQNPSFEDKGGWELAAGATLDKELPHSGKRALKISAGNANITVTSSPFTMKPYTRYRLTGWIRTSGPAELALTIGDRTVAASRARGGNDGASAFADKSAQDNWICYDAVMITGDAPIHGTVRCRYLGKSGAAWFDDIMVEEVAHYPLRAFGAMDEPEDDQMPVVAVVNETND